MPELLLELLSEEIPARMQARAAEDLKRLACERLEKAQLSWEGAEAFVTPRRLTLVIGGLPERQPDVEEPGRQIRKDAPDKALEGFVRVSGASVDISQLRQLQRNDEPIIVETPAQSTAPHIAYIIPAGTQHSPSQVHFFVNVTAKADYIARKVITRGRPTRIVLSELLTIMVKDFQWPKSMRWRDTDCRWVRPLHNILAVFADERIPFSFTLSDTAVLNVNTRTVGHRFLAPDWFEVRDFADYKDKLHAAKVIVDPADRRRLILEEARRLAAAEGLRLREDEALLDEVTGLVEWPVPMLGSIDPKFMDVPHEVLITAMRAHQKYFSLLDADGRLAPRFVLTANMEAVDGGRAIVAGNERVLRARLSDAKFFWDEDRKRTLESRVAKLAERVFHAKLGSDLQRSERLALLARALAPFCGADPEFAERAAGLCKADLTTAMVGEFPELQGIMGRHYGLHDGEPAEVGEAIAEHYSPQGPSDRCPTAPVSVAVALADKLDTLIGFFRIDEKPTGSKDPFALRRAALGIIRLIIENNLRLPLHQVFQRAAIEYDKLGGSALSWKSSTTTPLEVWHRVFDDLLVFFADRLKVHLREQGVRHDLIAAVFAGGAEDDIVRLLARVDALRDFLGTEDGANLLVAYRRASNIVRIEENKDGTIYDGEADGRLLEEHQEIELYRSLAAARAGISGALEGERFGEAMATLAGLRAPVDAFFDHVTVNCRESHLRVNRLRLLSQIRSALGGVADFSQIEG